MKIIKISLFLRKIFNGKCFELLPKWSPASSAAVVHSTYFPKEFSLKKPKFLITVRIYSNEKLHCDQMLS